MQELFYTGYQVEVQYGPTTKERPSKKLMLIWFLRRSEVWIKKLGLINYAQRRALHSNSML